MKGISKNRILMFVGNTFGTPLTFGAGQRPKERLKVFLGPLLPGWPGAIDTGERARIVITASACFPAKAHFRK